MATIEFLLKRVEGKEKEIAKYEKQIERIEKAKSTNWEKNPYYYTEDDLRRANKYLSKAKNELEVYKSDLETAKTKENSRNIKVINDFLDEWEERTVKYFTEQYEKYRVAHKEYLALDREYCEWFNNFAYKSTAEERKTRREQNRKLRADFNNSWKHITQFCHGTLDWNPTMIKDVHEERNRKYDDLVNRVCSIVGTITDCAGLRVGNKGDLNGVVIGDKSKASVTTIGAGGYNEDEIVNVRHGQCYHFRCLVKEIK